MNFLVNIPTDSNYEDYKLLLPLGLMLVFSKVISIFFHHIKLPKVIGYLLAGIFVGLIFFIPNQDILTTQTISSMKAFSKIGVILIMFSAGVETDLRKVKTVGLPAFFIALCGVVVPMVLAFVAAILFDVGYGKEIDIFKDLYYGVILTATSVSITVATLKEMGKLDSKVGNALVSAAIIDDIMGIIVLSLVISLGSTQKSSGSDIASIVANALSNNNPSPALTIASIIFFMLVYFGLTFLAGFLLRKLFNWLANKYDHHVRIVILSLACCLIWAYVAELFNIADITGAYLMGIIFSSTGDHEYIDHRAETTTSYIFGPLFFGCISLNLFQTNFDFSDPEFIHFMIYGLVWIALGLIGKILGCFLAAKAFKFTFKESLSCGVGMMARAEVLIVCAQKGIDSGLVSDQIMPFCLILILISSFLVPICLKLFMADKVTNESIKQN